jgi:signal peptidase I
MIRKHLSSIAVIIGVLSFRSSLADQYVVPSGSMEPSIHIGDHIWVDKRAYDYRVPLTGWVLSRSGEPKPGEVIVFLDPKDPSRNLVKRLVGAPGDHIRVVDGWIERNGQRLATSVVKVDSDQLQYRESLGETLHLVQRLPSIARPHSQDFVVPPGHYFFMGDNRDNSSDSRAWGFVSRSLLRGKALRVLYNVGWEEWLPKIRLDRTGKTLSL